MTKSVNLWLWYCSIVSGLGILLVTGLVTNWGEWYSPSQAYRMQTDAMLNGELALSHAPDDLALDLVWANDGVQQVWGLGIPVWRLPFEVVARLFGQPVFPDRLALGFAIILLVYGALRILTCTTASQTLTDWLAQFRQEPEQLISVVLLTAFPPIITLDRGPFKVYEEAVVYGYLCCVGLFLGLIVFQKRPTTLLYLLLSLFSGLVVFVRPTFGSYGLATVAVAFGVARHARWDWWKCASGPVLFSLGGCLLYYTNEVRFGSGLEFGHNLNLTGIDLIYTSRFVAPFHEAPLWGCVKELFGSLFMVHELNGFNMTRDNIVFGQLPVYRWRNFYTTTYDLTYLMVMLFLWAGVIGLSILKKLVTVFGHERRLIFTSATWSLIAFFSLFLFYLKHSAISSRYMLDFAPAIAVAMAGGIWIIKEIRLKHFSKSRPVYRLVILIAGIWLGWQYVTADLYFPPTRVLTKAETLQLQAHSTDEETTLPDFYALSSEHRPSSNIYRNGTGWNEDGTTGPVVVLFVDDPENISLEIASSDSSELSDEDCEIIQAKVGLEFLELSSIEDTQDGKKLTFASPENESHRSGFQVLFMAFVSPDDLTQSRSRFRLLSVHWH